MGPGSARAHCFAGWKRTSNAPNFLCGVITFDALRWRMNKLAAEMQILLASQRTSVKQASFSGAAMLWW
jgi:hypothetical protein